MRIFVTGGAEFIGDHLTERFVADGHDADAEQTYANSSKASEPLGYEPSRAIREGVTEFVEWDRANREWYERLVLGG